MEDTHNFMKKNSRYTFSMALVIFMICGLGFSLMSVLVSNSMTHSFDSNIISWVQGLETPLLTIIMKFFTMIGGGMPIVIIMIMVMAILYQFLGHRRELIFIAYVMMGSWLINKLLKQVFQRDRPMFHRIAEASGYSFPSGHSMNAFALYGAIAFLIWKHVPTLFGRIMIIILSSLFIVIIGVSRIYLGVHYPSDVIGGYLMSACWLTLSIWLYQRYFERM